MSSFSILTLTLTLQIIYSFSIPISDSRNDLEITNSPSRTSSPSHHSCLFLSHSCEDPTQPQSIFQFYQKKSNTLYEIHYSSHDCSGIPVDMTHRLIPENELASPQDSTDEKKQDQMTVKTSTITQNNIPRQTESHHISLSTTQNVCKNMSSNCLHLTLKSLDQNGWDGIKLYFELPGSIGEYSLTSNQPSATYDLCLNPSSLLHLIVIDDSNSSLSSRSNIFWSVDICTNHSEPLYYYSGGYLSSMVYSFDSQWEWSMIYSEGLISSPSFSPTHIISSDIILTLTNPIDNLSLNFTSCQHSRISSGPNCNLRAAVDYCLKANVTSCMIHLPPLSTILLLDEIYLQYYPQPSSKKLNGSEFLAVSISIFGHGSNIQPDVHNSCRFLSINSTLRNYISIKVYDTHLSHFGSKHLNGGVFFLSQVNSFRLENVTLCGNIGHLGGVLYATNSSRALLDSCFFSNNTATSGGVIYGESDNENWIISNSVFSFNYAEKSGGAIFMRHENPYWYISDNVFHSNSARDGGVIYVNTRNILWVISDSIFEENIATRNGSALYALDSNFRWFLTNLRFVSNEAGGMGSGLIFCFVNNSGWIVTSSEMKNNIARFGAVIYGFTQNHDWILSYLDVTSNAAFIGGAMYLRKSNNRWSIIYSNFHSNTATSSGGVIFCHSGNNDWILSHLDCRLNTAGSGGVIASFLSNSWNLLSSYFFSNTALMGVGGVMYASSSSYWILWNTVSESNSAATDGGAIFGAYSTSWRISNSNYIGNYASGGNGGGLCAFDSPLWLIFQVFCGDNLAKNSGGMIHATNSHQWEISGTKFFKNSVKSNGGAIFLTNSGSLGIFRSKFISNFAGNAGGVIYQSSSSSITIDHSSFKSNSAPNGGVIYNSQFNSDGEIRDSEFISNSAHFGGGVIYCYTNNLAWNIYNVRFHENQAISGGVIYHQERNLNWQISFSTLSSNSAQNGGAIYLGNSNLDGTISNSIFTNCSASKDGGVLFSSQANSYWAIFSTDFNSNVAKSNGGVILVDVGSEKWQISQSIFSGNSAGNNGGVISSVLTNSFWVIAKSRFEFNHAKSGGAISNNQGNIGWKIIDSTFVSNVANTNGGCISVATVCASWEIFQTQFMNNTAKVNGGSLYVYFANTNWTLHENFFSMNTAIQKGGAIYIGGQNDDWMMEGLNLTRNKAVEGGGIYITAVSNLHLHNSLFLKQSSTTGGGLAITDSKNISIISCQLIENVVRKDGAGTWLMSLDSLTIHNSTFHGNEAIDGSGSGIWLSKSDSSEIMWSTFVHNIALHGSGAVYWASLIEPKGLTTKNIFSNNIARVGDDVASSSVSLVFVGEFHKSSTPFTSKFHVEQKQLLTNTSRQYLQPLEFQIVDYYGQLCVTENNSVVASTSHASNSCGKSEVLNGEIEIITIEGVGRFNELRVICGPKGSMIIYFKAELGQGTSSTSLTIEFLDCVPGEYLQSDKCVMCREGTYSLSYEGNPTQCHKGCPVGSATCYGNIIEVEAGWWRGKNTTARVFQCPFGKLACIGGEGVGTELCQLGYQGPLCAVCSEGYYLQTRDSTCQPCPNSSLNIFSVLLILIFGGIICAGVLYLLSTQFDLMDIMTDFTVISCFVYIWNNYLGGNIDWDAKENQLWVDRLTCKTKIYVTLFQILSSLPFVLNFTFPDLYRRIMGLGSIVNLNFFNDVALSCDYPFDFIDSLLFITIGPIVFTIIYIGIYSSHCAIKNYLHKRQKQRMRRDVLGPEIEFEEGIEIAEGTHTVQQQDQHQHNNEVTKDMEIENLPDPPDDCIEGHNGQVHRQSLRKLYSRYLKIYLFLSYLVLPGVSIFIFRTFSCIDLDPDEPSGSYLRADYSISCESNRYLWAKSYAIVMIVIYPIGCTGYYYWLLYSHRTAIQQRDEPDFSEEMQEDIEPFSFLFSSYEPQYWYWEVIETARRVILTGVLAMFPEGSGTQLVFAIVTTLLFIKLYSYFAPFEDLYVDGDGEYSQFQIAGVFFITLLIQTDALPSVDQPTYDVILVVIATSIFLLPPLRLFLEWTDRNSLKPHRRTELSLFANYLSKTHSRVAMESLTM